MANGGIPNVLKPQPRPAVAEPLQILRGLLARCGLAPVLDMIGDEFPQYANDLHEIVNRIESDASALIGRKP